MSELRQKHLLLVTQYFDPEQFRVNDICEEWSRRGYRVTVLTGKPNYPEGKYYPGYGFFKNRKESLRGAEVIRLPLLPRGKGPVMLALNYLSFVVSGFFWKLFTRLRTDAVFIYEISPMTQALPGVWFARRRKIPCYLYVMDLWPESFTVVTGINHWAILKPLSRMVRSIYRRCSKIFVSSRGFVESVKAQGVPSEKLAYWPQYAESFYRPLSAAQTDVPELWKDGCFTVLFAGNIGAAQGLDVLPQAALLLRARGCRMRFCLIGDGSYREALQEQISRQGLEDYFQLIDRQPARRIPEFIANCDASLICLAKSEIFALTLPAKVQSCMACGKPLIVCGDGEVQRVVSEARAGVCADAGDAAALAEAIGRLMDLDPASLREMGANAATYFCEHFNKEKLLAQMDAYLMGEPADEAIE